MADEQKNRRKLYIEECKPVHSGHNRRGTAYTIYQVAAAREDRSPLPTNADGSPMKLRSFEAFPVGQVVDVVIEPYHSDQYGDSYTLKSVGGSKGGANTQQINEIKEHIDELYNRTAKLWEEVRALQGQRSAAPTSPVATEPAPAPVNDGLPSDDDIPF